MTGAEIVQSCRLQAEQAVNELQVVFDPTVQFLEQRLFLRKSSAQGLLRLSAPCDVAGGAEPLLDLAGGIQQRH
ncbi:MAG TPA: hypothetical protein VMO17_07930, partial [Terriglobia bacterium]|nr:hypothetical protein [Terriglobia bacterium]